MIRRTRLHRWAAWFQVLLLVPAVFGTICVRDDGAATWELQPCCCFGDALAGPAAPAVSASGTSDCAPCSDHVLAAARLDSHAGSRLRAAAAPASAVVAPPGLERLTRRTAPLPPAPCPPRRTPPTLRC